MSKLTKFDEVIFLEKDIFPSSVQPQEGIIYVSDSIEFIMFKCPCGCEKEVILPLIPPWGWSYIMENGKITISPGTGKQVDDKDCTSRYQIVNNEVIWMPDDVKNSVIIIDNNTH